MQIVSSDSSDKIVQYLTGALESHLSAGERVLWLVPGGSAIAVAAAVSQNLPSLDLSGLTVSLTDERYGERGHKDENWLQLQRSGFELPGATLHRVLMGSSMLETTAAYADFLRSALTHSDYKIGLFGMGADGHTAGIKPGSPAVDTQGYASSFAGSDFERITMTPRAISLLDEAVIYATGREKFAQIDILAHKDLPLSQQPAQCLKTTKKLTIFTDYKEENV